MAYLAATAPAAIVASVEAPAFGTGAAASNGSDLHGTDFMMLRRFVVEARTRNEELAGKIVVLLGDEAFAYSPVPPQSSFYVDVVFERGSRILPVPFELNEE